MPRFFADSDMEEPTYTVTGEDAKHLSRVLRVKTGEHIIFSTPSCYDVETEVVNVERSAVTVRVLGKTKNDTETKIQYHLYACLSKGEKFDQIVRQTTELGISEITPVLSKFCISRPEEKSMEKKVERYQKIAREAAGQSGRGKIPMIHPLMSFENAIESSAEINDCTLFYYEDSTASLRDMKLPENPEKIGYFIGSEGGFSREEAQEVAILGFPMISLGKRILRTETAPVAALAMLEFYFNDM